MTKMTGQVNIQGINGTFALKLIQFNSNVVNQE